MQGCGCVAGVGHAGERHGASHRVDHVGFIDADGNVVVVHPGEFEGKTVVLAGLMFLFTFLTAVTTSYSETYKCVGSDQYQEQASIVYTMCAVTITPTAMYAGILLVLYFRGMYFKNNTTGTSYYFSNFS